MPHYILFPQGSISTCYIQLVKGFHNDKDRQRKIRPSSLTLSAIYTNKMLDYIIEDVVQCFTLRFDAIDANSERFHVFIRPVCDINDYPEASYVLGTMNHITKAPYTVL